MNFWKTNEQIFIDNCNNKNIESSLIFGFCINYKYDQNICFEMINKDKIKYDYVNKNGETLLMCACKNGISNVSLELLRKNKYCKNKIKLNRVNNYNFTALWYACMNNMSTVALELIKTGESNLDYECGEPYVYPQSALIKAYQNKMKDVVIEIIKNIRKLGMYNSTFLFTKILKNTDMIELIESLHLNTDKIKDIGNLRKLQYLTIIQSEINIEGIHLLKELKILKIVRLYHDPMLKLKINDKFQRRINKLKKINPIVEIQYIRYTIF